MVREKREILETHFICPEKEENFHDGFSTTSIFKTYHLYLLNPDFGPTRRLEWKGK